MEFTRRFEILAVRHGRTAWNADGRFQGHTDTPLDETGRAQATGLRALFASESLDLAITSDLARARETAEIVLGDRVCPLEIDPRWREMSFGNWEGLTWSEISARHPELAQRSATQPRFFTPNGGESFDALCERVTSAVRDLDAVAVDGERVIVFTHAGVLHALLRVLLGESEAAALGVKFHPATVTRFAIAPNANRLLTLNESPETAKSR